MSDAAPGPPPGFWHDLLSLRFDAARKALVEGGPAWAVQALDLNISGHEVDGLGGEAPRGFAGGWQMQESGEDLLIDGFVLDPVEQVHLLVDGVAIKTLPTKARETGHAALRTFRYVLPDRLRTRFARRVTLGIASAAGPLVHAGSGRLTAPLATPNGDGRLVPLLADGHFVSKKSVLVPRMNANPELQGRILDAYAGVRDYLETRFGYRLFFLYGSLLGLHREGDFIGHDDDFDAGYFSRETTAEGVKAEMMSIMEQMVADGFKLRLSASRGFFKPRVGGVTFDVFPTWAEDGKIWAHNTTCLTGDAAMFEPVATVRFKDRDVYVPNDPEAFIVRKYGPDWRTPDKGFRAKAAPGTAEHLAKSALSEQEAEQFRERVAV